MRKNFLEQYIAYVEDNTEGYWFKSRLFGWGWTPVRWQGWAVTLGFIALILLNTWWLDMAGYTEEEFAKKLIVRTAVLVALLIVIAWRTGEKPRWMWGFPKDTHKKSSDTGIHPK